MDLEKDLSTMPGEPGRAAPVRRSGLAFDLPDPELDRLTRLASRALRCPMALLCMVSDDTLVFVSVQGLPENRPNTRQTPLSGSFCQPALSAREPFTLEDARGGEALGGDPVLRAMGAASCAGVPLVHPDGQALGVLCVADVVPRRWSEAELADLADLGVLAATELGRRARDADRRTVEQRVVRAERAQAIGQLAGGIAHDFNNLLTGIIGHVSLLNEEPGLSELGREDLVQIQRSADRAASLTRQLLAFSRRQVLAPRVLDVNALVAGCLSTLRRLVGERIQIVLTHQPHLDPIVADPNQLEQVLTQLCANARESMPDGGTLEISTRQERIGAGAEVRLQGLRPGMYILLQVRDSGRGMDSTTAERIFEPFFSTKTASEGAGLGLASVYGIVKQSGGHIEVASEPGRGTTFTIYLPRHEGSGPVGAGVGAREPAGGTETILLVEDEDQVRELARRVLERVGYTVLAARDAESATSIADRRPGHIHLLVTDMHLPQLSGRELAARLSIHRPAIKVLYISGTSDGSIARLRMLEPGMQFLEKPFSLDRLLRTVRQTLGDPDGGGWPA